MSRWQEHVDNLLTDLETETPSADRFRANIDHKIWEAERKVSNAVPMTPYETAGKLDPYLKTRGSASPNIRDRT